MLEDHFLGLFVLSAGLTDPQLTAQILVQVILQAVLWLCKASAPHSQSLSSSAPSVWHVHPSLAHNRYVTWFWICPPVSISPTKLTPKLHTPKQTHRGLQGFLSFISPRCSCTSVYGCLALMVRQVLHVPALKELGIFSNRELDLVQIYHFLLLMVLLVIKLFWNTVALFFYFCSWTGFTVCSGNKREEEPQLLSVKCGPCYQSQVTAAHIIHWTSFSLPTLWLEINCFSPSCSPPRTSVFFTQLCP